MNFNLVIPFFLNNTVTIRTAAEIGVSPALYIISVYPT